MAETPVTPPPTPVASSSETVTPGRPNRSKMPSPETLAMAARIFIFFFLIVGTCGAIVLIQVPSLLLLIHSHALYRSYIRLTAQIFGSVLVIVTHLLCPGTKFVVTGDFDLIRPRHKAIMMANHQIYPDWFYLWAFAWQHGCHGDLKILLMEWLKYLPVFGQGMWFFEFVFMKRKWALDKKNMTDKLSKVKDAQSGPLLMLIFPEGTLNTPQNVESSKNYAKKMNIPVHPQHLLLPKSTGLHYCASLLMPEVDDLFDVTVGYSGLVAGQIPYDEFLVDKVFFRGIYPREVHLHVQKFSLKTLPGLRLEDRMEASDTPDAGEARRLELFNIWLREQFYRKDERLHRFYNLRTMLSDSERAVVPRLVTAIKPELHDWCLIVASFYIGYGILLPIYTSLMFWLLKIALWPLFFLAGWA